MKLYTEAEVKKAMTALVELLETKHNDFLCEGIPYYPEPIEVDLSGQIIATLESTEEVK